MTDAAAVPSFTPMKPQDALDALPETYAALLGLSRAGLDDTTIAARLDLEPEAVRPLLEIAAAKLVALTGADPPATGSG